MSWPNSAGEPTGGRAGELTLGRRPLFLVVFGFSAGGAAVITFLENCVAVLHESSSKRRLHVTTGIDRAPRPTQPDFATWTVSGDRSLRREYASWSRTRAPSSQSASVAWGAREGMQRKSAAGMGRSRGSAVDRDDDVRSFDQRSSPMDRWRTALLGSAAAVAMLAGEPARAISINDQVAAAVGGIANYYDAGNQFPNVVSLFSASLFSGFGSGSFCTGSLINSRTILTAAHCFVPNLIPSISFAPIA